MAPAQRLIGTFINVCSKAKNKNCPGPHFSQWTPLLRPFSSDPKIWDWDRHFLDVRDWVWLLQLPVSVCVKRSFCQH